MIQKFTEEDIKEFKNMKDRFILRQIAKVSTASATNVMEQEVTTASSHDESDHESSTYFQYPP